MQSRMYYCGLKLLAVVVQKTAFSHIVVHHNTSEETGGHQVMKMLCDEGSDRSVAHLLSFDAVTMSVADSIDNAVLHVLA